MSESGWIGEPRDWPAWTRVGSAAIVVAFAVLAVLGERDPVFVALVALGVVPWVLAAAGWYLPAPVFVVWSAVPIVVLNLAGGELGIADLSDDSHGSQFTLMMLIPGVGSLAARGAWPSLTAAVALSLAAMLGRAVVEPRFEAWVFWVGGAAIALTVGFFLRKQQAVLAELRVAQEQLAGEAALEERHRIAREVHDVIAHSLTVTMMHLTAARLALGRDPEAAREALEEAERLGRRSMADIRRTVGLLRAPDERGTEPALPTAADVRALVGSYRAAGVAASLDVDGDLDGLDPSVGLALYRLVQEALANAARHAPGSDVGVSLRADGAEVAVDVRNGAAPVAVDARRTRGGGMGLAGMGERVSLLGGRLSYGPRDGGWVVSGQIGRAHV